MTGQQIFRAGKMASAFLKKLSQRLFWDVDPDTINVDLHRRYIIQRVLERGTIEDLKATIAHYTMPTLVAEAQQIRSLDPVTLAFAACLGNVKEDSFRCSSFVDGVKVDCVAYDMYEWIEEPVEEDGVRLAGVKDIGAMKINAVTNRGTRKDFVDLARRRITLSERFSHGIEQSIPMPIRPWRCAVCRILSTPRRCRCRGC